MGKFILLKSFDINFLNYKKLILIILQSLKLLFKIIQFIIKLEIALL